MRTGWLGVLAVLAALVPAVPSAVDAPHDGSSANIGCETCHKIHNATGGTLLNQPDNNTACASCHNASPALASRARLGLPWLSEDQAVPGVSGQQHRWDARADAPIFGAGLPADTEMAKRIRDGRIQCAACHDPHADVKARDPNPPHTSIAPGVATAQTGGTAGAMTMTLTTPALTATTKGYRVQVVYAAGGNFRIAISHNALSGAPAWFVDSGTGWVAGDTSGATGTIRTAGTPIALDDGTSVYVTFTGAPTVGQFWDFYVSYAHLRASNVADAMCLQCHATRNQTHTTVKGPGNGTTVFSHPVGEVLNANGMGYDRAAANVLDANGALQTTGDGNPSNDLKLDGGTTVRCTTCHSVHNADSNSLTQDAR